MIHLLHPRPLFQLIILNFPTQPFLIPRVEIKRYTSALVSLVAVFNEIHIALVMPDFLTHDFNLRIFFHEFIGQFSHFLAVGTFLAIEFV
jgi:hypothetical protein